MINHYDKTEHKSKFSTVSFRKWSQKREKMVSGMIYTLRMGEGIRTFILLVALKFIIILR